jgi:hypothetical protein
MGTPLTWHAPVNFQPGDTDYFAAQGMASRVFWWGEGREYLARWKVIETTPFAGFSYFATGGFSGPSLISKRWLPIFSALDRLGSKLPKLFAARLLVILQKKDL